jgi:hypothetical protein
VEPSAIAGAGLRFTLGYFRSLPTGESRGSWSLVLSRVLGCGGRGAWGSGEYSHGENAKIGDGEEPWDARWAIRSRTAGPDEHKLLPLLFALR